MLEIIQHQDFPKLYPAVQRWGNTITELRRQSFTQINKIEEARHLIGRLSSDPFHSGVGELERGSQEDRFPCRVTFRLHPRHLISTNGAPPLT